MTATLIALLGAVTWRTNSGGTWLLWLVMAVLPLFIVTSILLLEFRLTVTRPTARVPYLVFYVTTVVMGLGYEFAAGGWAAFILGSRRDMLEQIQTVSMPASLISPRFLITPSISFFDVLGIILANSFFWALLLFLCFRTVRLFMGRSRVQQIGLTGQANNSDSFEDD